LLNKDPGGVLLPTYNERRKYNNMNRQLLSTQEGLKRATRKYAMKLRSDLILSSSSFLDYFDKFEIRIDDYKLFEHKVLTSTLATICDNAPFHISDWWFFGLKKDLYTYFLDTKLADEPNFTEYFLKEENKHKINPLCATSKFAPEQYFGYECFSRNFKDIYMEDSATYPEDLIEKYRKCLVNNFIVLEYDQSGIYLSKYTCGKTNKFFSGYIALVSDLYNFYKYEKEYQNYCDSDYKITTKNTKMYENEEYRNALLKLSNRIYRLVNSKANIIRKSEILFLRLPILVIIFVFVYLKSLIYKKSNK
jgi:hypothetical protein